QQQKPAHSLEEQENAFRPVQVGGDLAAERHAIALDAKRFRHEAKTGHAIGRIVIGRIGLSMVLVNGTDHETLKKGPGRDPRSFMPGENRLVYIDGHRTTYLAPFSHIDDIRPGHYVRDAMHYESVVFRPTTHQVVTANDPAVPLS